MPDRSEDADQKGARLLLAGRDWSGTPLGAPDTWPPALRVTVELMLGSDHAMCLAWGPELTFLYNDAYAPTLGRRHPAAFAQPMREVWTDVWPDIAPLVDRTLAGESISQEDLPLVMERNGYPEDTWWSFSYSPARDDAGAVAGLFCVVNETTKAVKGRRAQAAEQGRWRRIVDQAPGFMAVVSGPEHRFEFTNLAYNRLVGRADFVGRTIREALPELQGQGLFDWLDRVYATGERMVAEDIAIMLQREPNIMPEEVVINFVYEPILDRHGKVGGIFVEGHDVTAAHRAQAALRESEERNRRIVEGVKDHAIFVADLSGTVTDWTPGAEAIFGWSADDIVGRSAELLFTPEDRAADVPMRELAEARRTGCANDERWHLRRDGARFFANGSVRPLHGEGGEVTGFIKIARDETERRATEARLRASEEFNRRILASSADCIKVLDLGARIEFMSEGGMCIMEVDDFGAVEGRYWPDLWPGTEHVALSAIEQAKGGDTGRFQGFATTMKGTPRWWDVIVTPIAGPDGRPEKLLSISRDVTATRLAEEALRTLNATLEERVAARTEERNLLATLFEATDVLVTVWALDYTILASNSAFNDEFERLYRVRPKAGDNVLALLADRPDEAARVREAWDRALAGEEFTTIEPFGASFYEVKFHILRNPAGAQVGAYQFVTDVSERIRSQEQLLEAQEALRQSQKMEAMGQLTGGVAHDFNNLLTPIVGSLDLLLRRGVGDERERRLIDGAMQSADRAKTLVQRLLAFARRQPLQPVAVDLAALVCGMTALIGSTLGPAIDVRVDVSADLPPVTADVNQLEMAILNLAVNARDAMPDGGALTVTAARASVRQGHRSDLKRGHYVRLSVTDTGAGMDEGTLGRAIEPFFSTKGVGKGTGLGLSMVHGLAAQLGGGLTIDSAPGRGTTVELWLPISLGLIESDAAARAVEGSAAPRGRVLLVDDEDLVRMSTADMLADLGWEVEEASSAEEALGVIGGGAMPDLLVTDHLMPGMTGADLAREVRAIRPALPILIVSGYAEADDIAPDLPRLTKPFRNAELADRLQTLFATRPAAALSE